MMRYPLALLAALTAAGCAAGPKPASVPGKGPQPAGKPPAAPAGGTLPASAFLGNYPPRFRQETQRQWSALPAELRKAPPPAFRILTGAELKKLPGLGGQESSGAFDATGRCVYTRYDIPSYHARFLPHELGHWAFFEGRDPKSKFAALMTAAEVADWVSWNERNWRLIPQYCSDVPECNRKKAHESFAQATCVSWYPGGRHPDYGRANPQVAAKLRSYFGP